MQQVQVQCPKCKSVLNIKNTNGESEKVISCPKCKSGLRVKFPEPQSNPMPIQDEGHTMIGEMPTKRVNYILRGGGQHYRLRDGVNSIGRKAPSSQASLMLDADAKMSRHHAKIDVQRLPDGSARLKISNWQNKNKTFVDGVELVDDEVLILHNGSVINMGGNAFTLKEENPENNYSNNL